MKLEDKFNRINFCMETKRFFYKELVSNMWTPLEDDEFDIIIKGEPRGWLTEVKGKYKQYEAMYKN